MLHKLLGVLIGAFAFAGFASAEAPIVRTHVGPVQGVEQGDANAYLGIPYAAAPIGDLRWRAPQAPQRWRAVRQTNAFGASCPQPQFPIPGAAQPTTSEDCLFLNIWAPKNASGRRLPVMFWIHGGSYIVGSGNLADTSAFTRDGVVLVSLNYRLGRLGFFAHPALSAANADNGLLGNYGILDQIAALRWVKENIARFGGDPNNVTIFGVSAGATFTDMLMYSPLSEGLFHRAIAESDPFTQPWPYLASMNRAGERSAESNGEAWAASVGAANASVAQLRAIPAERALAGPNDANAQGVKPLIDGRILPERGPEAFAAGLAHRVPYIVGGNSYEGSLSAVYTTDPTALVAAFGANGPAILQAYGPAIAGNPALLGATITGDTAFLAPRRIAARQAAAHGVPTWSYHFAYVPEALRATVPGAGHGSEVPFVFESFQQSPMTPYAASDSDRAMARQVHAYWINFAKTGNPNGAGLADWPQFSPSSETIITFNNDGVRTVNGFRNDLYDLIEPSVIGQRLTR